jgi:hypothetical protein
VNISFFIYLSFKVLFKITCIKCRSSIKLAVTIIYIYC